MRGEKGTHSKRVPDQGKRLRRAARRGAGARGWGCFPGSLSFFSLLRQLESMKLPAHNPLDQEGDICQKIFRDALDAKIWSGVIAELHFRPSADLRDGPAMLVSGGVCGTGRLSGNDFIRVRC
jgi:hypothetical protein